MSPQEFNSKWRASTLNERASSQEHFIGLCRLLDEPTSVQADPAGTFYRFEKAVSKTRGGDAAIAEATRGLNRLRENWLNPPVLVHRVPEVVPGFPDRILSNDAQATAILKRRTLTNLYNARPTWLQNAHAKLDFAVAAAYGFPLDISNNDALAQLLALNHGRANQ